MFSPSQINSGRLEGYPRSLITRQVDGSNLRRSYKTVRRGEGRTFNGDEIFVLNSQAAILTSSRRHTFLLAVQVSNSVQLFVDGNLSGSLLTCVPVGFVST